MNKKWLIDTDIIIDLLRGIPEAINFMKSVMGSTECFITPITIAELYGGVREGREQVILDQFITEFQVTLFDLKIAQKGGIYRRDFGKSHSVGLADALIAASAESYGLTLATLNKKHYPMLKTVHIPYRKLS
ncbi:MAG: type II toxin-antitoxin system VapC family toxin [Candidatus Protochlamydia sp.]|nr:type II toxin-antitoxin system VapC family toxin [Candidatus Protochlamydia sp.]